jgi:hypothetical protein
MNFISSMEGQEIHVELKYCERCGGLWLRPQQAGGVYCFGCRVRLADRPVPEPTSARKPRRKQRPGGFHAVSAGSRNQLRIECLHGVSAAAVRA